MIVATSSSGSSGNLVLYTGESQNDAAGNVNITAGLSTSITSADVIVGAGEVKIKGGSENPKMVEVVGILN